MFCNKAGFTLVEVVISMVIFAIISVCLLRALTAADKIKSRGATIQAVSTLARNEAESIKNINGLGIELIDTTYSVQYNKKEYTVERKIIDTAATSFLLNTTPSDLKEVEIRISDKVDPQSTWKFRLLQGVIF